MGFLSEYKPIPWDLHCGHGNAIVEECLVSFWLKSVEIGNILLKSFSNFKLGFLSVISIFKITPYTRFQANWMKNKEVQIFHFFYPSRV